MTARHTDVANKVIEILRTLAIPGVRSDEIRLARFPFDRAPSKGLAVSPLTEAEGIGNNELDDVIYPVQLTRILHSLHPTDGLDDRHAWRDMVRRHFHHKRIGVSANEISTTVQHAPIEYRKDWVEWNIDSSALIVSCLIRETRT